MAHNRLAGLFVSGSYDGSYPYGFPDISDGFLRDGGNNIFGSKG
jgi:hypothetical protein